MKIDKLIFQVVIVDNEKLFQISGTKRTLFLNKILSVWFEGYHHSTKCLVLRNNEPYDEGHVNYYGTHAATDYFFGFKLIVHEQMTREILAETLELGDVVEIEKTNKPDCQKYSSANNFIERIVLFWEFSQSVEETLKANEGKMRGDEFINALISCAEGVSWGDRMKKVNIIRW